MGDMAWCRVYLATTSALLLLMGRERVEVDRKYRPGRQLSDVMYRMIRKIGMHQICILSGNM